MAIPTAAQAQVSGGVWALVWEHAGDQPRTLRIAALSGDAEVISPQLHGLGTGPGGWTPDEGRLGEIVESGGSVLLRPGVRTGLVQVYARSASATVRVGVAEGVA